MRTSHYWFYDEFLLFNFRLVWPVNLETLTRYCKDEFDFDFESKTDTFGGKSFTAYHGGNGETFVVALRRWTGNADCHAVLAHECSHAAIAILEARGITITMQEDEALAYLTAYLVRKCLNQLLPKPLRVRVDPKVKPKSKR